MAVILQFRSQTAVGGWEQNAGASSQLSDLEQLLQSMQAVDSALSEIRSYLLAADSRRATAGTPDHAEKM